MNNKTLYDFSGFRVDTGQRCLWRGDDLVSLTPKAFETLLVLIKNKGNVVAKDSILDEVWKDTFVEEATLAQNISTLRKTLAKYDTGKEFIVTIPRRGYRFVDDVTEINTEEEELIVERRSVTHIVTEQEQIDTETAVARQQTPKKGIFANRKLLYSMPLALIGALIAGVAAIYFFSSSNNFYNTKFQKFRTNSLFSGKNILAVTASPDGKYLASIERNKDGDSIALKQIESGNPIKVLPKSNLIITGLEFSSDGNSIFYTAYKRSDPNPKIGSLYKIPILGGGPQEVLKDIDSPVAVSKDNQKIAFVRNKLPEKKSVLVIAKADGSNEKELAVRELSSGFSTFGMSWSPDGKFISTVIFDLNADKNRAKLVTVNSESGELKTLAEKNWLWLGKSQWLKDGSGIAVVAYGAASPNITDEIWFVSYPEGEAKVISNNIKGVIGFSLTDDAGSIIATQLTRITGSYIAPLDDLDDSKEIAKKVDEESLLPLGVNWVNNERIIYSKTENGNADIWTMKIDGSGQKQITSDKSADYAPVTSADGRYIFFLSNRSGGASIWRMNANGESATEVVKAKNVYSPSVSPNEDTIYYSAKAKNKAYNVLWRADFSGKNAKQLTDVRTYGGNVSPDGKYILCFYPDINGDPQDLTKPVKFTVISSENGEVIHQFASLKNRSLPKVEWQKDGKSFLILENVGGESVLSVQKLDQKEPEVLKNWKNENVYQLAISNDGEKLFFDKGTEVNSVIQLKDTSGE